MTVQRGVLIATGLGLFMIFLDALIMNVALPDIQADFGIGESGLQWMVTAYTMGMAVFMMSSATLADRKGRRLVYLGALVVFTGASVACGIAPTIGILDGFRAVQGVAAAAVNVTSLALVSAAFVDPDRKARAIGIWTAIASIGLALGPTLGGFLTRWFGWRSVFFVNLPVGIVAILFTLRFIEESTDPRDRGIDLPGQLLYVVSVGAFAYAIIEGPHVGWLAPSILIGFAVFGAGVAAFVVRELRTPGPMMDVRLFRNRTYTLSILTVFATLFGVYGMLLVLTQFWQNVRRFGPIETGLLILPFAVALVVLSPRVGGLVARHGTGRLVLLGLGFLALGFSVEIVGIGLTRGLVTTGVLLVGVGAAFTMTPSTTEAMNAVPKDRAGMASGIMSSQRALGSTAGYAVLGSILAATLGATLNGSLTTAIPNATERTAITHQIIDEANPRAYVAEIGPGRPVPSASTATRHEIADVADHDFEIGIRLALAVAVVVVLAMLVADGIWFPRKAPPVRIDEADRRAPVPEE